ncbi:trypsin-like peptidase domain-containing protein [Streptomyces paromomycinus]|uniref:Serine protease n=1 Tax=Streptomyces paromomycinus TaxID=92743 RepID=A0A401W164_STREY|nr:trypsin-like peptidase domain-containing protein [Streptomyces paromomycinus]GCD43064.1 serine protease [Streptomyces paromomycinus]
MAAPEGGHGPGRGERADREKYAHLLGHAGRATVAVRPAPGVTPAPLWGSGVFVAPGWVLTCAHVLTSGDGRRRPTGPDGEIGVAFDGRVAAARLEYDLSRPAPVRAAAPPCGTGGEERPEASEAPEAPEVLEADREAAGSGPASAPGPRVDLALLRLLDPGVPHPCAWLSDQPAALLEDAFIFRGHDQDPPGTAGAPCGAGRGPGTGPDPGAAPGTDAASAPVHPFIAVRFGARDARGLQFGTDVRVTPGASGGPLLDCDRGEVVGIVKGSHREDRLGLAVPVTELRGLAPHHLVPGAAGLGDDPYHALMGLHDRWHWAGQDLGGPGEPTWFDAQHAIMSGRGRLWGVQERLQALDLLASLPAPRDPLVVAAAVAEALGRADPRGRTGRAGPWTLRTWRDGHGALYQGSDPYTELCAFVHYLRIVAQRTADEAREAPGDEGVALRTAAERLELFVTAKAVVLLPRDRERIGPVRRRPDALLVEFEPLFYDDAGGRQLFNWSVSEGYGQGRWQRVEIQESRDGMPFEQACDQVLQRLGPRLLRADDAAGGARVRLEVAVPEERWHTPADRWRVPASTRRAARLRPLGPTRAVVLRDQGRRQEVDPVWLRRWQGLAAAGRMTALRVPAGPRASVSGLSRLLEEADEGAVPALCRSVADGTGLEAVGWTLDTGHPVALWLAEGHGERDCDRVCDAFHREVAQLLGAPKSVAEIPELVRELRAKAAEGGASWARDLVLLYDDPDNPIPQLFPGATQLSPP